MTAHMIFGVKVNSGFTRKARFDADRYKVDTPHSMK